MTWNKVGICLLLGIASGMLCISGCSLTRDVPVQTFVTSSVSLSEISEGCFKLIKHERLADEGTLSLRSVSKETTVLLVEKELANKLRSGGYAVQQILSKSERQAGDVSEQEIAGTELTVDIRKLDESDLFQLNLVMGHKAYYRLLTMQGRRLIFASSWIRQDYF